MAPFTPVHSPVMNVSMGYVSGTFGAGNLTYSVNTNASAAVTGTSITPVNNLVGQGNNAVAKLFTTSTLPAAPTPIRNFVNLDAFVGSLTNNPFNIVDDVQGSIIISQGCALTMTGTTAAGTSPLVVFGITWEEVQAQ